MKTVLKSQQHNRIPNNVQLLFRDFNLFGFFVHISLPKLVARQMLKTIPLHCRISFPIAVSAFAPHRELLSHQGYLFHYRCLLHQGCPHHLLAYSLLCGPLPLAVYETSTKVQVLKQFVSNLYKITSFLSSLCCFQMRKHLQIGGMRVRE